MNGPATVFEKKNNTNPNILVNIIGQQVEIFKVQRNLYLKNRIWCF